MSGTAPPRPAPDRSTELEDTFRERWPDPDVDLRQRVVAEGRSSLARAAARLPDVGPSPTARPLVRRVETYWRWFAVVLYVVVTLDMVSTLYAADAVGLAGEANPLVRAAVDHGVLAYAAMNLVAVVLAIGCFAALVRAVRASAPPYDRYVEAGLKLWLGLLLAAGLLVFANNLIVVVYGRSLVG